MCVRKRLVFGFCFRSETTGGRLKNMVGSDPNALLAKLLTNNSSSPKTTSWRRSSVHYSNIFKYLIASHLRRNFEKSKFAKFWKFRPREECGICRSHQALFNEYLVAKVGFDTAENGRFIIWDRRTGAQLTKFDECTSSGWRLEFVAT